MIEGALKVPDLRASDLMIPRAQVDAIDLSQPRTEWVRMVLESGHSRFPAVEDDLDNVLGVLHAKDLLKLLIDPKVDPKTLLRPARFIPESQPLNVLLRDFKTTRSHLALVIDEFGSISGLITIEDVLEQIFGEIEDEHDIPDLTEKQVGQDEYVLSCRLEVKYLNEKYGLGIEESKEYDTLAGFIIFNYDGIPTAGETVFIGGLQLRILRTTRSRIELARVKKL